MVYYSTGAETLRAENVSKVVTGFALQEYRFKEMCLVQTSNAWKETYFKEPSNDLSAIGSRNIKGVSRGASFPHNEVTWEEASARNLKFAFETTILWEDAKTDDVPVITRSLLRVARSIAKATGS